MIVISKMQENNFRQRAWPYIPINKFRGFTATFGKIGIDDLPHLLNLLKEMQVLIDGIKGIKEIPSEIKDIEQAEAIRIGSKIYEIIRAVKQQIKK